MIEDVELTRGILEHFAQDSVGFPANLTYQDICEAFNDVEPQVIAYHLWCACDAGLLDGDYTETKTMDGTRLSFGYFVGLNIRGSDYVHNSRSPYWDKAIKYLKENKATVTTAVLVETIPAVIKTALGLG